MLRLALLRRKVITDTFNCKVKQQVSGLKSPHLISGSIAGTPINSSFCFACANETLLRALCFFLGVFMPFHQSHSSLYSLSKNINPHGENSINLCK